MLSEWLKQMEIAKIHSTPVSVLYSEDYVPQHQVIVDGSKITKETGFKYSYEKIDGAFWKEPLDEAITLGIFPPQLR